MREPAVGPMPVRCKVERVRGLPKYSENLKVVLRCSSLRCREVFGEIRDGLWQFTPGYAPTQNGIFVKSLRAASRHRPHRQLVNFWIGSGLEGYVYALEQTPERQQTDEEIQQIKARLAEAKKKYYDARNSRDHIYGDFAYRGDFPLTFRCSLYGCLSKMTGAENDPTD